MSEIKNRLPTELMADLKTHHIEGITNASHESFSVPLITHVTGNLWQGGCVNGVDLRGFFDHIISLYPWERYNPGGSLKTFLEARLYDSADAPDGNKLVVIADLVSECMEDGLTLVHCQAGLNRSALVSALALIRGRRDMKAKDAIALLRRKRCPQVLCNKAFEKWLLDYRNHDYEVYRG